MSDTSDNRSIKPKPNEDMIMRVKRLKVDDDFMAFINWLRERGTMLAYQSCNPMFNEKQVAHLQGRVHELVDMTAMVDKVEDIIAEIEKNKRIGGKK